MNPASFGDAPTTDFPSTRRNRWRRTLLRTMTLTLVAPLLPMSTHAFCGFYAGKADASLFNEASQVVLVRDGNRTVLSMLNDYSGPLNEFALIVPTPTVLTQGQVRVAEKTTFERLDAYSSPRLAEYHDSDPCQFSLGWGQDLDPRVLYAARSVAPSAAPGGALQRNKALGVTVEAQYTLEEYDIVSLSATQSDGLEIWLRENGYTVPKGASAALRPYINQGMKFFVAKVNLKEQSRLGYSTLRPLQFAFESEKFMLPMRLGMLNAPPNKAQDLIVYVLTKNGRVESSNYRTAKLAANENIPPFVKPKFKEFYKALYDSATAREDYRVVFTEYFWDMGWCDPCAADPLTPTELRKAGVFWVGVGDVQITGSTSVPPFAQPAPGTSRLPARPALPTGGGAQPVMLTRLHVRYTANTFPEDLMFTQTKDRQNWQTRYVIQNPYAGSVAACSDSVAKNDCEAMCRVKVPEVSREAALRVKDGWEGSKKYAGKSNSELAADCADACSTSKRRTLELAAKYYERDLPVRLVTEKETLAKLTGWSMAQIDKMAGARVTPVNGGDVQVPEPRTWWQKLFGVNRTPSGAAKAS